MTDDESSVDDEEIAVTRSASPQQIAVPLRDPFYSTALLRIAAAVAVLLAGASIAYYFIVYVPERDSRARADAQAAAGAQAASAAQAAAASAAEDAARRSAYQDCLGQAQLMYSNNWDRNCVTLATNQAQQFAQCLSLGGSRDQCAQQWPTLPTSDCTLPNSIASSLNNELTNAKARCLDEAKANL